MADSADSIDLRSATVSDLGEFGLIARILDRIAAVAPGEDVVVGPGDDAALLRVRSGHVVISTDTVVEGRHFRRDWVDAPDAGRRAAAQNLSDINAMGGRARWLTLGLALPGDLPAAWALDFVDGFCAEAAQVGAGVVGGDITASDKIVASVTVLGACTVAPVLRSGARPGDVVALCGRQGWSAGGLAVLGRGFRSPRVLVEAYRHPEPPYEAGPIAAEAGASAMIDVSDGLIADATHLAHRSEVWIDLHTSCFEVPEPLQAVSAATGADPIDFVLSGGEDHCLLATFPADVALPDGWREVGEVRTPDVDGARVSVDGAPYEGVAGWTHF